MSSCIESPIILVFTSIPFFTQHFSKSRFSYEQAVGRRHQFHQSASCTWFVCAYIYSVIYPSAVLIALMLVGPSKCLKQIIQTELNEVKNPNWREATRCLFTIMAEDLNSGLPWTNPASGQSGTWTRGLHIASPALWPLGHTASCDLRTIRVSASWVNCTSGTAAHCVAASSR